MQTYIIPRVRPELLVVIYKPALVLTRIHRRQRVAHNFFLVQRDPHLSQQIIHRNNPHFAQKHVRSIQTIQTI